MSWTLFPYFAIAALLLWAASAICSWRSSRLLTYAFSGAGLLVFAAFILGMWLTLGRPPMRTMGETRLWYTFFISLAGLIVYSRWGYKWITTFSFVMALVFTCVNLFKPEIHSTTLMPALQSPWFAPHVTVYMFAYALFGAAALMAIYLLWIKKGGPSQKEMSLCDDLVGVGLAFMTIGMLFGAVWAEQAWGHYWSWDPKETWAAATWLSFLCYIHIRRGVPSDVGHGAPSDPAIGGSIKKNRAALYIILISFVLLQLCWWGINYLPSAQGASVHTYNA